MSSPDGLTAIDKVPDSARPECVRTGADYKKKWCPRQTEVKCRFLVPQGIARRRSISATVNRGIQISTGERPPGTRPGGSEDPCGALGVGAAPGVPGGGRSGRM